MPWREIFIVVCFLAAIALAAAAYLQRTRHTLWFASVVLTAGTLFTGVALLLDDWVIVVALAAGAVTAAAVSVAGFVLSDRLDSSGPEARRQARDDVEYFEQQEVEEVEARIAAAAAGLQSEPLDDRFAAVSELAALSSDTNYRDRIRYLLAGHVRIRAHDDDRVGPDVEAALAALGHDARPNDELASPTTNLARAQIRHLVLADADLRGAVLLCADLEGALLEQVSLASARLTNANLRGVRFADVNLSRASLSRADLEGALLERVSLAWARLTSANLRGVRLADVELGEAVLSRADLEGALLERVNLAAALLADANLRGVRFADVDLSRASLSGADLEGALLERVKLPAADLGDTNLRGVRFVEVDLSGALLSGADLSGATLERSWLRDANYDETTKWPEGFNPTDVGLQR